MPILAGILSALFLKLFGAFASRLTFNLAFAAALVAVVAIAYAGMKAAMAGLWAIVPAIAPDAVVQGMQLLMPGNLSSCAAGVILTDVVAVSWDYWKMSAGLVAAAVKP